jgi:hypothetical protein
LTVIACEPAPPLSMVCTPAGLADTMPVSLARPKSTVRVAWPEAGVGLFRTSRLLPTTFAASIVTFVLLV